jgi:hypothetical protein
MCDTVGTASYLGGLQHLELRRGVDRLVTAEAGLDGARWPHGCSLAISAADGVVVLRLVR